MKKLTTLFLFLLCAAASAQITPQKIDSLMNKAMNEFNVVGASIAVIVDGKIVLKKGYGVKSISTNEPVNEFTNFQIASNSKAFTTAALSILVDEGKISWNDKVTKFIPEFKMYNEYVTLNFTIEDLLCHRSGLSLGAGDLMQFPSGSDFTIDDVIKVFQYFKPVSPFRTKFDYDNQLYFVAGEIVKRVSGMTWEEYIQTKIFNPLQMENSYPSYSYIKDFSNIAKPHFVSLKEKKIIDFSQLGNKMNGAAGSIFSNADDMAKWIQLQLNGGKYGEELKKMLFSGKRQNEMWKIHTIMDAYYSDRYKAHFSGYGLGWFLTDQNGSFVVEHTGGLDGMLSIVRMVPDKKFGIVVLTNTADAGSYLGYVMANTLTDYILDVPEIDWSSLILQATKPIMEQWGSVTEKVWKKVEANKNVEVKNENFIGVYEDKWFGKCEVFMNGKQLWFKSYRSPKLNGPMKFYNANTFAIPWEYKGYDADAFALFTLDENGKAQSIKMKGISPNIDFSFDFQDLDLVRIPDKQKN